MISTIYLGIVLSVTDGDTFKVRVETWPQIFIETSIRVYGIDTPEKGWRGKCDSEKALGSEATEFAKEVLQVGTKVALTGVKPDKYSKRYNATVSVAGVDYANLMISNGYAVPYYGKTKISWCSTPR